MKNRQHEIMTCKNMENNDTTTQNSPHQTEKYNCEICHYNCSRKQSFDRHLQSQKHSTNVSCQNKQNYKLHVCKTCNTEFKDRAGLWRHNKKCTCADTDKIEPIFYNGKDISNLKPEECSLDIIMHLVKQNEEFKKIMIDQNKNMVEIMSHNQIVTTNNTINSNNKTMNNQFNLNLFLNETCKDAMNINEFIDYVTVNLDDFENFGKVGYPKALGEIIVRNLNELDIKMRPIHCSDLKREVLHVKHDGVWHSDDSQKFIKRSITYVANKNIRQRPLWQDENPESKNCLTSTYERFNNICLASLGPATDEQEADFLKKITTTIAREVVIDKKKKY